MINQQKNPFLNNQVMGEKSNSLNKRSSNISKYIPTTKISMFLILVLQLVLFFILLNPIDLFKQFDVVKLINTVNEQTTVPPAEIPVVNRIGDGNFPDLKTILESNQINADVFKDAKDGDYVLNYTTKMIIYRRSEDKIIYDNLSPNSLVSQTQQAIVTNVVAAAKAQGLISQDSTEVPQLSLVTDEAQVRSGNPGFYKDLENGDVLATFGSNKLFLIYRQSNNTIVNYGKVNANITDF